MASHLWGFKDKMGPSESPGGAGDNHWKSPETPRPTSGLRCWGLQCSPGASSLTALLKSPFHRLSKTEMV